MITGTETDVVVIGAGHNGLTAAAYLARAGLRATVVERRHVIGGATVTEEIIPGFRASTCSYVAGLLHPRVLSELELTRFGLKLYQTDASLGNIFPDGRSLFLYNELDRTLNGLRKLSPGEAERFVQFGLRMERFARLTGSIYLEEPPPLSDVVRLFDEAGETELFNEFFTLSVKDLLDRYFESDLLKGLFAFFSIVSVWGGPRLPGTAYVFGHHSAGEYDGRLGQYGFPVGGMGAIADALAACARAAGAQIRTSAPVQRVIVERGRAAGVVLEGGEEIRAPLVVSNADPRTTFLRLMDPDDLPGDFREQVQRIDVRGSMARVFIAVEELPHFDGLPSGDGPQHRGLTLLGGEVERYEEAWDAQRYGRIPDELVIEYIIQTAHDPTVGPPGKHLITTGVQQLPFELEEGTWDDRKDAFTRQVVDQMCRYAPNLRDRIIDTSCITPLDLEREYGMTGGNIFHAAMGLNQLYGSRPLPGFASYRSPVEGLYLCGAGTHPGGAVTMAPGHNAAMTVLRNRSSAKSATTGARGRAAGSPTRTPMIEKVMERPAGRKAGVFLARQRFLRPVVERLSRRKPQ